jgi:hypothetical protein
LNGHRLRLLGGIYAYTLPFDVFSGVAIALETVAEDIARAEYTATPKDEENPNLLVIFPGRLMIDKATKTIVLDDERITITHAPTFQLYTKVAEAKGGLVEPEILHEIPGCRKGRLDVLLRRHIKTISEKLWGTIIGITSGGGYSITLPPLDRPNQTAKKVRKRAQLTHKRPFS